MAILDGRLENLCSEYTKSYALPIKSWTVKEQKDLLELDNQLRSKQTEAARETIKEVSLPGPLIDDLVNTYVALDAGIGYYHPLQEDVFLNFLSLNRHDKGSMIKGFKTALATEFSLLDQRQGWTFETTDKSAKLIEKINETIEITDISRPDLDAVTNHAIISYHGEGISRSLNSRRISDAYTMLNWVIRSSLEHEFISEEYFGAITIPALIDQGILDKPYLYFLAGRKIPQVERNDHVPKDYIIRNAGRALLDGIDNSSPVRKHFGPSYKDGTDTKELNEELATFPDRFGLDEQEMVAVKRSLFEYALGKAKERNIGSPDILPLVRWASGMGMDSSYVTKRLQSSYYWSDDNQRVSLIEELKAEQIREDERVKSQEKISGLVETYSA